MASDPPTPPTVWQAVPRRNTARPGWRGSVSLEPRLGVGRPDLSHSRCRRHRRDIPRSLRAMPGPSWTGAYGDGTTVGTGWDQVAACESVPPRGRPEGSMQMLKRVLITLATLAALVGAGLVVPTAAHAEPPSGSCQGTGCDTGRTRIGAPTVRTAPMWPAANISRRARTSISCTARPAGPPGRKPARCT